MGGTALAARGGAVLVEPRARAVADAIAALLTDDSALSDARGRACAAANDLPTDDDLADQLAGILPPPDRASRVDAADGR